MGTMLEGGAIEPLAPAGAGRPPTARDASRGSRAGERARALPIASVVRAVALAWGVVFAALGALVHESFLSARYDLGNYVQAIDNTAHGRLLEATTQHGDQFTRLGVHVEPILLLFAPIWRLWPSPLLLVVLQPLVLAAGALPTYWLARKHLGSERQASVFAAAYLLYPATQWNAAGDFHPVSLAPSFLLFAIWYLDEDQLRRAVPFLVLAAATKEHIPLLIAWLGVLYWARHRRHVAAVTIVGASLTWFAVAAFVLLPHFAPPGVDLFADRYGGVGGSPARLAETIVLNPARIAAELGADDVAYALFVAIPLCGLFLFQPLLAAGAAPELTLSILSSRPEQTSIGAQYTASLIAFLVAASILGAARLSGPMRRRAVRYLVGVSALAALISPLWSAPFSIAALTSAKHDAQAAAVDLVPSGAPVSATNHLGAHLSARRRVYGFPQRAQATWVVVDADDAVVADVPDRRAFRRALLQLRRDARFRLVYSRERVQVFRRLARPEGGGG